jgi:hypothetical protein
LSPKERGAKIDHRKPTAQKRHRGNLDRDGAAGPCRTSNYSWSKGNRRLAGDTARTATSDEVKDLKR